MRHRMVIWMSALLMSTLAVTAAANAEHKRDLERKRVSGVVERIDGQEAYIRTESGARIGVQLGPQSYWRDRGYRLRSGTEVEVDAWYDPDGRSEWYFAGGIWGPGFHFELSNGDGIPYWVDDDDYYYSEGWGPCCDSYTIWYDCAPAHYIYAPPPPPRYVFYGPRWRHHYRSWHHDYWRGPHYDRGRHGHHDGGWDRGRGHDRHDRDGWRDNDRRHDRRDDRRHDGRGEHRREPRRLRGR